MRQVAAHGPMRRVELLARAGQGKLSGGSIGHEEKVHFMRKRAAYRQWRKGASAVQYLCRQGAAPARETGVAGVQVAHGEARYADGVTAFSLGASRKGRAAATGTERRNASGLIPSS